MQSLTVPSTPRPDTDCGASSQDSPRLKVTNKTTASELLAAFSPRTQSTADSRSLPSTPVMSAHPRQLRQYEMKSYTIFDDSGDEGGSSPASNFSPVKRKRGRPRKVFNISADDEDELSVIEPPKTPPPRVSSAGHSLRQHKDLHQSLKAQENADKRPAKRRKLSHRAKERNLPKITSDMATKVRTVRNEVRGQIASETTVKRGHFFVAHKEYFLPLLPENNHIIKLLAQNHDANKEGHVLVPYEDVNVQPQGVTATMKPYQLKGLSFLVYLHRNGLSGILGDEMGLGKTLQTLSLIQWLKEQVSSGTIAGGKRPCLVVCPLSVLSSWLAEARRWTPELKVLRYHGPVAERDRLKKVVVMEQKVDLVITTYETFAADQSWLKRAFVWRYVILDEGHKIKNDLSLISTALQGLSAEHRLILTGTPLQNNLIELWALLHWLYPEVFTENTAGLFKASFDLTRGQVNRQVMDDARKLLEIIMIRRMKCSPGVELNLPPKIEMMLYVPLTPLQRFWYTRLLTRVDSGLFEDLFRGVKDKEAATIKNEAKESKQWEEADTDDLEKHGATGHEWEESKQLMEQAVLREQEEGARSTAWRKLMNLLMQLRKCCNHPYTLPSAAPDPYVLGDHVIKASGKFIVLEKMINELVVKQKKKVLIFSTFTRMLDCCEDLLNLRGGNGETFKYMRFDGATGRARRNLSIRMFNDMTTEYRVMLISTRAGGLGINLTSATDVIMLDQDWNPQITLQAEARAHRIGQTRPVTVYKLCTQGTVEEQMIGRIYKKLYLSAKVTESMRDIHGSVRSNNQKGRARNGAADDDDAPNLDTSQLLTLVRRGAQALAHPEIDPNDMLRWDFETMLEECKDKSATQALPEHTPDASSIAQNPEDEEKWLARMEVVETRIFEGKKHLKPDKQTASEIPDSREERRIGKNTTIMVNGYAINKESMLCADWEAVPTLAGKDPRLAEPQRAKRAKLTNQEHCQVCWDGGDLVLCSGCPRSYHFKCLEKSWKPKARAKMQFHCQQHECADCQQKTADAGGMIYRCRFCERGFCEDCLDWNKTDLIGENLPEYELLGFPEVAQAFYIRCSRCYDHHVENPEAKRFCMQRVSQIDEEYGKTFAERSHVESLVSRAESMTDATTVDAPSVCTPKDSKGPAKGKRAAVRTE